MPRWNQPGCPCCGATTCQNACPACGGIVLTGGTIKDSNGFEGPLLPSADIFGNQLLYSGDHLTPGFYNTLYEVDDWLGPPFPRCAYVPLRFGYRFDIACGPGSSLTAHIYVPPTFYCEDWDGTKKCGFSTIETLNARSYLPLFGATATPACDQDNSELMIEFKFETPLDCSGVLDIPPPATSANVTITYKPSKDFICCYPCLIPKKDLILSVFNGLYFESHVLHYSGTSPAIWLSDCISLGGASFRYYAKCGANNQIETGTVLYNGGNSPSDCADKKSPSYYPEVASVRRASCSPYHIEFDNGSFLDE